MSNIQSDKKTDGKAINNIIYRWNWMYIYTNWYR